MLPADIPHRLKALREASGLAIRTIAAEIGLSPSGYAHYENPTRFKDEFLPMALTRELARVLGLRGVSTDHVMALAGSAAGATAKTPPPGGFSDDAATPWVAAPDQRELTEAAIRALVVGADNPETFRIRHAVPALGMLEDDIVIVDRKRLPVAGEIALGNARQPDGRMVTVIGRYHPPFLVTPEALGTGKLLDQTTGEVAIYHPVVASFRICRQPA